MLTLAYVINTHITWNKIKIYAPSPYKDRFWLLCLQPTGAWICSYLNISLKLSIRTYSNSTNVKILHLLCRLGVGKHFTSRATSSFQIHIMRTLIFFTYSKLKFDNYCSVCAYEFHAEYCTQDSPNPMTGRGTFGKWLQLISQQDSICNISKLILRKWVLTRPLCIACS